MVEIIHGRRPEAKTLFIDPETGSKQAIRCYAKAGFVPCGEIIDEEGDPCLMMKIQFA